MWHLNLNPTYSDAMDIFAGDPVLPILHQAATQWFAPPAAPVPASAPAPASSAHKPKPAPEPAPSLSTPKPGPSASAPSCIVKVAPAAPWKAGDGSWQASVHLTVSQTGPQAVTVPWTLELWADGMRAWPQAWTWQIGSFTPGYVKGTVGAPWAALQAQGASSVQVGGVVNLTEGHFGVQRAALNGKGCSLEGFE